MWAVSKHHGPFITTAHVRARSLRATVYEPTSTCATPERSDTGALHGTNPQTQSCWNLNIPRGIPTSPGVEGLGRRATPPHGCGLSRLERPGLGHDDLPGEEGARPWPHTCRAGREGQGPGEPPVPGFARKSDPDLDLDETILDIHQ